MDDTHVTSLGTAPIWQRGSPLLYLGIGPFI